MIVQGRIIGIQHPPEKSSMACDFGCEFWVYFVMDGGHPDSILMVAESEVLPLSIEQLRIKIQSQIEFHQEKINALTQQLESQQ